MKDDQALKVVEAARPHSRQWRLSPFAMGLLAGLAFSLVVWALIYFGTSALLGF